MVHTEETKNKLSEMRKGENNPFYGKHHTEEFKKKLSERARLQNFKRQYDLQPLKAIIPSGNDIVYLAGFCDADGSIRFTRQNGKPRPFIAFYNTNQEVINWIFNKFGGAGSIQYHNKGRLMVQSVRLDSAKDVYFVVRALLPFLIVKKEDALMVINFLETKYGDRLIA
jgi:hypothetical protein